MSTTSGGGLARSTAVMAAGTATSRVLGLVRAMVLVGAVGLTSSIAADAFASANYLPNVIYMLIAGGVLNAVLVPQVVRAYRNEGGQEYVDRLLTLGGALLLGVTVVLTLAAPLVVRIAVSGADPGMIRLATAFAFWCIPQVFFYGVYTLLGQVLNARGVFGPYMWAPVVNNIVAIAGIGVFIALHGRFERGGPTDDPGFWDAAPVALLGGAATLGVIAQALVLLVPLRRIGFRYRPRRDWRGVGLGSAARVAGWTFAALLVGQVGILIVTRVATGATGAATQLGLAEAVAGKAAYDYAFLLFMLPHSLVTVSLVTALFTRLSTHAAEDDVAAVRRDVAGGLRSLGLFTVLATAVLIVLALPVSRVIAIAGSAEAAGALAPVVVAFALGLVALGAWTLVQRVYYAYEDARALFWLQVPMAGVVAGGTLLGSLLLPPQWWVVAAAGSIAASYVLGAVRGAWAVRRRLGGIGGGVRSLHLRAAAAALGAAVIGWPLSRLAGDLRTAPLLLAVLVCVVVGVVMVVVYAVLLRVLGVDDLEAMLAPLVRRLPRSMRARLGALVGSPGPPPDASDDDDARGTRGGDRLDVEIGQGTLLAGRYRLTHPEQSDLPGVEVWSAVDQILDRGVRVSFLREGRTRPAQDAARRAALVSDPRLLRIIDVSEHEGLGYVVTDPLPGRDLATLTARGPLPPEQARAIIGEAAVALEVARRRGVHHLALRPSVIRVTEDGRVVVAGLAMDGALVHRGAVDARSTTRADTVGLVQLLYLALTGRWPAGADVPVAGVPTAPVLGGAPVPPAELTSGVPNDLDTLCAVTLGPHDDGPHSPVELVRELEPWDQVDPTLFTPDTATAPGSPADGSRGTLRPGGPPLNVPPVVRPAVESAGLTRTSARAPIPGAARPPSPPGTPPPAAPTPTTGLTPVVGSPAAAAALGAGAGAAAGAAVTPPPSIPPASGGVGGAARPSFAPVRGGQPGPSTATPATPATPAAAAVPAAAGSSPGAGTSLPSNRTPRMPRPSATRGVGLLGAGADRSVPLTQRQFDPTPWVLLLVAGAVVLGILWAWNTFTAPAPPIGGSDGFGDVVDVVEPQPTAEGPESDGTDAEESPEPTPTSTVPPVIAAVQQLDPPPNGDNNEHPEAVDRAIDGDPGTFWFTRTYTSPTYGMKNGVGFALTLQEPAVVSSVTMDVNGAGGMVEIRATDPSTPTQGTVLASGPMGPGTVFELSEPTEAAHIVLWFPELPQTPEGKNRVELREVTVS